MAGSETREIALPISERTLELRRLDFLQRWRFPTCSFEVVTAYDHLRHNGADLGKRGFLNGGRDS